METTRPDRSGKWEGVYDPQLVVIQGIQVAYLNLIASVSEPQVSRLLHDPSFVIKPTLILGVSHLLATGWVAIQPLGELLHRALDGGRPLSTDFWDPLRPPGYHPPLTLADLSQVIGDAWEATRVSHAIPDDDWLSLEVGRLLWVVRHSAGSGECIVSVLDRPSDAGRSGLVRFPWELGSSAQ